MEGSVLKFFIQTKIKINLKKIFWYDASCTKNLGRCTIRVKTFNYYCCAAVSRKDDVSFTALTPVLGSVYSEAIEMQPYCTEAS